MVERPDATASQIAAFFEPLFSTRKDGGGDGHRPSAGGEAVAETHGSQQEKSK